MTNEFINNVYFNNLQLSELEEITGGGFWDGVKAVGAGLAIVGSGALAIVKGATATGAIIIAGVSVAPALVVIGGIIVCGAGVALTGYGISQMSNN